jgi:large subunit ribosomal protein L18
MSIQSKIKKGAMRRRYRVRNKIYGFGKRRSDSLRVSIFKSLNHIYAQVIDDVNAKTVASCSTKEVESVGTKIEQAHKIGLELGKKIKEKNLTSLVFDRGSYKYHGRVKALADGLRESGISI